LNVCAKVVNRTSKVLDDVFETGCDFP
jgi:hypothetical protein